MTPMGSGRSAESTIIVHIPNGCYLNLFFSGSSFFVELLVSESM